MHPEQAARGSNARAGPHGHTGRTGAHASIVAPLMSLQAQPEPLTRSTAFLRLVSISVSSTKFSQRPWQSAGRPTGNVA